MFDKAISISNFVGKNPDFMSGWKTWEVFLFWTLIAIAGIMIVVGILGFVFKQISFIFKKLVLPILLVLIGLIVLFFVIVALADTYFGASWWDKIRGWFEHSLDLSNNVQMNHIINYSNFNGNNLLFSY